MKAIRGRADARWLPSRHRFALFRLFAYFRLRSVQPRPDRGLLLVVDRDQSAFENQAMSIWMLAMVTCYTAELLFARWPLPLALLAGFVAGNVLLELPIYTFAVAATALAPGNHLKFMSMVYMSLLIMLASWFATSPRWIRFVAWQFFFFLAMNALSAIVMFALRGAVARLESTFGGEASAG